MSCRYLVSEPPPVLFGIPKRQLLQSIADDKFLIDGGRDSLESDLLLPSDVLSCFEHATGAGYALTLRQYITAQKDA